MPTKTVLIADHDLGFVFWIGQRLDDAGYQAFPANSASDAAILVREFHLEIDLLIYNPSLKGIRAFAKALRLSQGHLKTIVVLDEGDPGVGLPQADELIRKPSLRDEASRIEWLETVETVFTHDDAGNARSGAS